MASVQHVPAWKKLGLKLKYARETAEPIMASVEGGENGHKRKGSPLLEAMDPGQVKESQARPGKRTKKFTQAGAKPPVELHTSEDSSDAKSFTALLGQAGEACPSTPSSKRRKSVSFTPDTKTEDGESSKQLYQKWLSQQDDGFDPDTAYEALKVVKSKTAGPDGVVKSRKTKKPKKSKSTSTLDRSSPSIETAAVASPAYKASYLQYLDEYHTSRATWRFGKAKQIQLIKNILDIDAIPMSYNDALKDYMSGLQGEPVRSRIRSEALKIRQSDIDEGLSVPTHGSKPQKRRASDAPTGDDAGTHDGIDEGSPEFKRRCLVYADALKRFKAQLRGAEIEREETEFQLSEKFTRKLMRRQRAELLLWSVGEGRPDGKLNDARQEPVHLEVEMERPATAEGGQVAGKRKRRRRRRTGVPDDDTSSEESDSEDEEEANRKRMKRIIDADMKRMKKLIREDEGAESSNDTSSEDSDESTDESEDDKEDSEGSSASGSESDSESDKEE